jgi:hypothetical protein
MIQRQIISMLEKLGGVYQLTAIGLLFVALVTALMQKQQESAAAQLTANAKDGAQHAIKLDEQSRAISLAAASLAILSFAVSILLREKRSWALLCIVALLFFYTLVELMML